MCYPLESSNELGMESSIQRAIICVVSGVAHSLHHKVKVPYTFLCKL